MKAGGFSDEREKSYVYELENLLNMLFSMWGYRAVLTVTATNYINRKKHSDSCKSVKLNATS